MLLYNFARLINKYSVSCEIVSTGEGKWEAGEWKESGATKEPFRCAIIPMTERRINNSGGDYKAGDCNIVSTKPLQLDTDVFILYKGKTYKVEESSDYSDYSDFYSYTGKRVSSFDKYGKDTKNHNRQS